MDNDNSQQSYQQNTYQQNAYQQNAYQQQPYQQQQYPYQVQPSLLDRLYGKSGSTLESVLKLFSIIFFCVSAFALLMGLITAIISATDAIKNAFLYFYSALADAFVRVTIYLTIAIVFAYLNRKVKTRH